MGNIITVNFRGDHLYGFENDDGMFVALKPMVESMGMDWSAQLKRVKRDQILSEGMAMMATPLQLKRVKRDQILSEGMAMMATPFGRGGEQECACLKLELVNGWLFTIDASRITNEAVRDKVILYQREGYQVLFRHFYGRSAEARRSPPEMPEGEPDMTEPLPVRRQLVTEARQSFGVQSARELWFKLGLPTVPSMFADQRQPDIFYYTAIRRDAPTADAEKAA